MKPDHKASLKILQILDNKKFVDDEYDYIKALWDTYELIRENTNKLLDKENERHKLNKSLISSEVYEFGRRFDKAVIIKFAKWSRKNKSK